MSNQDQPMDDRIKNIDQETLIPLIRQALDDPTAVPASWDISIIYGGFGSMVGGTALYRVAGQTESGQPWSLVLKVLYARPDETVDSPYYWKREYELYRSRMLDALPETGLTTPLIYACTELRDACWIWMEEVRDKNPAWSWDDFRLVARRLGRFNGAYLTGHPIPNHLWLTDQWHCRIVPPLADVLDHLDDYLKHPLPQRTLPVSAQDEILSIWHEREAFSAPLTSLPQTFCHLDVFPRNMFHNSTSTKLIDWALAGRAAVGEELVCFVALSLYSPRISPNQADFLDQTIFGGYIAGLRDMGWTGDAEQARLGYTCAMTLRGLAGVKQDLLLMQDENRPAGQRFERIEDMADFWAGIRRFRLLKMAKEARSLLGISS
ncbi:MAG: phosphotransferase [Anaerolineae bacterium]|nr:phosphotransferase [Anaerolineae bacterium]